MPENKQRLRPLRETDSTTLPPFLRDETVVTCGNGHVTMFRTPETVPTDCPRCKRENSTSKTAPLLKRKFNPGLKTKGSGNGFRDTNPDFAKSKKVEIPEEEDE